MSPSEKASAIVRAAWKAIQDADLTAPTTPVAATSKASAPATRNDARRNIAPQSAKPSDKTNPPRSLSRPPLQRPRPLTPRQLTAARLLLAGRSVGETARELRVHRYTITRWKSDPRFDAELRRQVASTAAREAAGAAPRNMAPHGATFPRSPAQNEPKPAAVRPLHPAAAECYTRGSASI